MNVTFFWWSLHLSHEAGILVYRWENWCLNRRMTCLRATAIQEWSQDANHRPPHGCMAPAILSCSQRVELRATPLPTPTLSPKDRPSQPTPLPFQVASMIEKNSWGSCSTPFKARRKLPANTQPLGGKRLWEVPCQPVLSSLHFQHSSTSDHSPPSLWLSHIYCLLLAPRLLDSHTPPLGICTRRQLGLLGLNRF